MWWEQMPCRAALAGLAPSPSHTKRKAITTQIRSNNNNSNKRTCEKENNKNKCAQEIEQCKWCSSRRAEQSCSRAEAALLSAHAAQTGEQQQQARTTTIIGSAIATNIDRQLQKNWAALDFSCKRRQRQRQRQRRLLLFSAHFIQPRQGSTTARQRQQRRSVSVSAQLPLACSVAGSVALALALAACVLVSVVLSSRSCRRFVSSRLRCSHIRLRRCRRRRRCWLLSRNNVGVARRWLDCGQCCAVAAAVSIARARRVAVSQCQSPLRASSSLSLSVCVCASVCLSLSVCVRACSPPRVTTDNAL